VSRIGVWCVHPIQKRDGSLQTTANCAFYGSTFTFRTNAFDLRSVSFKGGVMKTGVPATRGGHVVLSHGETQTQAWQLAARTAGRLLCTLCVIFAKNRVCYALASICTASNWPCPCVTRRET